MIVNLTQEQSAALRSSGDDDCEFVDPLTSRSYVVVDRETHFRAMDALRKQQDREAIAEGLAQMEAGQGRALDVAFAEISSRLGFAERVLASGSLSCRAPKLTLQTDALLYVTFRRFPRYPLCDSRFR
jgi:hypothetical protein